MNDEQPKNAGYYVSVIVAIVLGMVFGGVMALCLSIVIWYMM